MRITVSDSNITEWELKEDIAVLKLNNPPQNQIIEPDFITINEIKKNINNKIKGLIITGEGRHFSAGADKEKLFEMANKESMLKNKIKSGMSLLNYIENLEIPTISSINGICFGGGLEIALSTHIRVCSKTSLLAFPEVDLNLIPGLNGIIRLQKITGTAKTLAMVLSGEIINAEKAYDLGFIDYLIEKNATLDYSLNLMNKMTANRPISVINSVVRSLKNARTMKLKYAMQEEIKMFTRLAVTEAKRIREEENRK